MSNRRLGMHNPETGAEIGRALNQALMHGILVALKILWPYILVVLVLVLVMGYLKARIRRAERDAEYRRMAEVFREVNQPPSSHDQKGRPGKREAP